MSSRACPREKIYFVVNEKHLFKKWPELVSEPRPFAPDECPERIISGRGLLDNTDMGAAMRC